MAVNIDVSPLREFAHSFAGATAADWMWQVGVAATALVLGWYAARVFTREVKPSPRWQFGEGDFERVAYPLLVWAFMEIGKLILQRFQPVALLQILVTLLIAWVIIRLAVYVLGHVLPQGGFLRAAIRVVAWVAWIGVLLHLTGLLPEARAAFDDIGITVGKTRITLLLVLQAIAALALTLTLAAWISRVTESRVLAAESVEMSTRVVITKLVRVATMFLAVLVALPLVGIDVTALSIFGGALGVGLGFGLQKIASNYVSGFIVLLDRSLRIGDLITVDGRKGNVMAIASRYTVIKGSDGTESIIPNEKLITESVNHHTFTDTKAAVPMGVSVSYGSDVERALALMLDAARAHKRVIAEPAPVARVKQLNESGIDLELVCWISDPAVGDADLKSDIFRALMVSFREAGIEFPFPRRDVRLLATGETKESPFNSAS